MSEEAASGIRIRRLTKTYGRIRALHQINLDIQTNDFLTIVGANGAGKSTLLGIIAGLIRPSRGQVLLDGQDMMQDRDEMVGYKIGVLADHAYLYEELTVYENLQFYGRLYDVRSLNDKIESLLERVGMISRSKSMVKTLSRGMRQRVALARAMVHDPPVLLLDEPYVGLDQGGMDMLQMFLTDQPRTVLLVTHDLPRGLEVSDRIAIMSRGRMVYEATSTDLSFDAFDQVYRKFAVMM